MLTSHPLSLGKVHQEHFSWPQAALELDLRVPFWLGPGKKTEYQPQTRD
jgi:hypothetical protein